MNNVINFQEAKQKLEDKAMQVIMNELEGVLAQVAKEAVQAPEADTYNGEFARDFKGSKYQETKDLDVKEIAKLVRKDIKEAIKKGFLPKMKTSVTIDRYSMGQSICVRVTEYSDQVLTDEYQAHRGDWTYMRDNQVEKYMPQLKATVEALKNILQAYNQDSSDSMVDYYSVKFSGSVSVSSKLEEAK